MVDSSNTATQDLSGMPSRIGTAWIDVRALDELFRESARAFPLETGGVLMGYQVGGDTVVTTIVGPGPAAQHRRTSYLPDHEYQELEIARIYRDSGRVFTYLGDWHTHPNGGLRLSATDTSTLKTISAHAAARLHRPVMMIAVGRNDDWKIGGWQWTPSHIRILSRAKRLEVRTFSDPSRN